MRSVRPTHPRALTVSAAWGISAAPARAEPLGAPGAWTREASAVESAYGSGATLHLSFEEFARTFGSRAQEAERRREGGVPLREIRRVLTTPSGKAAVRRTHAAYRKFRAFDRPNVLHWYPTLFRSPSFAREFPEAVQTGPFWPGAFPERSSTSVPPRSLHGLRTIVWYASPGSSSRLASLLAAGLAGAHESVRIDVRAPRVFELPVRERVTWRILPALPPAPWRRRFASADLRIVTGSRTLIEAIELGRPFLYFNGVLGRGRGTRRHRPEKLDGLLRAWAFRGASRRWRHDLASVGRLQRVEPILRRLAADPHWDRGFPRRVVPVGFAPPYADGQQFLRSLMDRFDRGATAMEVAAAARSGRLLDSPGARRRGV
ncbi:MAG: hypothetical protein L3K15_08825 [Thermoplasmata archaeon]|nr:hypothetical protein [Thermoplasmata archaeon]